ncbi:hypothetical protein PHYPSEUDO_009262 [Phytophthora pseudosyringae]|uniref:NADP-dependent oxidoreductase domain-containing protein n=1 Tax=Phytophthora pseudosyringae TaxID=221518 RepID=A0A8T1VHR6_9STRA|nr:hypothetical protein PHYPSEUDO_009262 [Phytophthora pseudosyringae]
MSVNVPTKTLPSGAKIPALGLGVYQSEPGPETYNAVLAALKVGYRHIDTAQYYENEADVGRAVKDSGIPREEIFVTSKLFLNNWGHEKALATTKASNEKLGLGYIDLYLLHAPGDSATRADSWKALEELQEQGILKDIGVSNFGEAHLDQLMKTAKVKPAVNQVELHPWLMRSTLVKYCKENGILLQAYSPLARAKKMDDPTLNEIAKDVGATPAQVLVAFSLANDFITLPKSVHEERIKSNLEAASIKLTPAQVATLVALDEYLVTGWDPIKDHAIPVVGLGVYQSEPGPETYNAVLSALKLGYRHIDTAQYYENEADVGRAIKDSSIPREEIFVTSKFSVFNWGYEKAIETTKASNGKLGLGYIDLYLLHAPGDVDTRDESWRAIEELREQGILKDIGVSNFGEAHLEKLLKAVKVKPAVNQVELHPWLVRPTLVKYCQEHGILLEAYSPLARAQKMENRTLLEIANAPPAQVLVAFCQPLQYPPPPKSVHEERQQSNLEAASIKLTSAQAAKLAALDEYLVTCWDPIKDHAV